MDYRYKAGFSFKVNANVVGQTIEEIEKENGEVTAKLLLDKSRPKKSPTHDLFEWDDKKAAEHYRMHTARCVINSLQIVCEEIRQEPIVAYINVAESKPASYVNVIKAMTEDEMRENYMKRAKAELEAFVKKYKDIEELADILLDMYKKLA